MVVTVVEGGVIAVEVALFAPATFAGALRGVGVAVGGRRPSLRGVGDAFEGGWPSFREGMGAVPVVAVALPAKAIRVIELPQQPQ